MLSAARRWSLVALIFGILAVPTPSSLQADLEGLLKQVPAEANGLLLINAPALRKHPAFQDSAKKSRVADRLGVPETAQTVVLAAEYDIQHMVPLQQIAALDLSEDVNLARAARSLQGYTDRINQIPVIWLERGCLLALDPRQVTLVTPLNRQSAARWLRSTASRSAPELSSFLADASQPFADGTCQLVLALDMTDLFDPTAVKAAVANSDLFDTTNREAASTALASLRGLAVQVNLETSQCRLSFRFGESPDALRPVAKDLIRRWLASVGAGVEGIENWELSGTGDHIDLLGPLDAKLVNRILSLHTVMANNREAVAGGAESPDAQAAEEPQTTDPAEAEALAQKRAQRERDRTVRRSQNYFGEIDEKLRDLQLTGDNLSFNEATLWVNNYSRLIESLPTSGVDPELVAYGQSVSRGLENILTELNIAHTRAQQEMTKGPETGGTRVTAVPYQRVNVGGHMRYRYAPMVSQDLYLGGNRDAAWDQVNEGNDRSRQILNQLLQQHEQMRKTLTDRYEAPF